MKNTLHNPKSKLPNSYSDWIQRSKNNNSHNDTKAPRSNTKWYSITKGEDAGGEARRVTALKRNASKGQCVYFRSVSILHNILINSTHDINITHGRECVEEFQKKGMGECLWKLNTHRIVTQLPQVVSSSRHSR